MTEELNEQQKFYKKLEGIIDILGTCYNQYTDTEYKDVRIYDKIDLLIQKDENGSDIINNSCNTDLRLAQQKIREVHLLLKDLMENILRYD